MIRNRKVRRTISTLVLLSAGAVVWNLPMGNVETGNFVLKPLDHAEIRAWAAGFVTDVHYSEGERVSAGTSIATMEVPELSSEIAQKRSQIAEARAVIRSLGVDVPAGVTTTLAALSLNNDGPSGIESVQDHLLGSPGAEPVKGKVHEIEAELEYAQQKYEQSRVLNRTKVISDDQLGEMKKNYQVWLNKYRQVLAEQEAENARLARLMEELMYLHAIKAKLALRSPIDGIVTTPRTQAVEGRYFEEGELIFEVVDPSDLEAEVTIGEQNISSVGLGQRVVLKPFSLPYRTFEARVGRIAPVIQQPEAKDQQTIAQGSSGELKVYCDLERPMKELAPGMSGYARIYLSDDKFGNVIMHRLTRFIRTEFWW